MPGFNFTGNEDCLFLSVYAPQNKTNLPVLVWIRKSLIAVSLLYASNAGLQILYAAFSLMLFVDRCTYFQASAVDRNIRG